MTFFEHGRRYKIMSAFDGTVLDVRKQEKDDGAKVLNWFWNGQPHQIWAANQEGYGFRLTASHVSDLKALDEVRDKGKVIIWSFHGSNNQLWNAYPVADRPGLVFIKNAGSQNFLRNMGQGVQVQCSMMNHDDPCIHWIITPV